MSVTPSGAQFAIAFEGQRATIVEVGGGIREYEVEGRPVLDPYAADAMCDGARGAVLVPWPNRVDRGRYRFDDAEHQLDLSEPDTGNAIHGLLRWHPWRPVDVGPSRVEMAARLHPTPGYPFALDVTVGYQLSGDGLTVRTTATNVGDRDCPFGCGHHPYLSPGAGLIDGCTLRFDAGTTILTNERQLPSGRQAVQGAEFDFREGKVLGDLEIDHAFTDLWRDEDGRAVVRSTAPDGRTTEVWLDEAYPFVEVYTGHTLAPDRRRHGLAVEPMTCPPDAFNSGEALIRLEPGGSVTATWGVRLA